jgi:hypothetical protein
LVDQQSILSGGLNISADPSQLQPNQVRRADNARLTQFGGLLKRLGSQNIHAAAIGSRNPVREIFAWEQDDGTQQLLAVSNGHLHYGSYDIPMSWTQVASPTFASAAVYPVAAAFRDDTQQVVYFADGGKLLKWDGATLTRSATTPNVSFIWVYNQRLYGCVGSDAVLLASGLNNGDDLGYTAGEGVQVPIRTFGESSIVGGVALGVSNLIFHRHGISRWTGVTQDDIAVDAGTLGVSPDTGTIVPNSIVATETEVYFLSDRGFYAVNSQGLRRISTTLDPNILALFTDAGNLHAVHNRFYREVEFYLPDTGYYAFNYQLQAWTGPWNEGYIDPISHSACEAVDTQGNPIVLVGTADGFVKQMDAPNIYTDNVLSDGTVGTAVGMISQFRRMFFGDPPADKSLRWLYILVALNGSTNAGVAWTTATSSSSASLSQTGGVIWGSPSMVWGSFVWGTGDAQEYRVPVSGRGSYVDVTFTDSGTNTPPLVSALRSEAFDYGTAHEYN